MHQSANFRDENELKFNYMHLQFQNFPGFLPPDLHYEGGREGMGWKERGWEGREREEREEKEGRGGDGREGYDLAPKINSRIGQC